MPAALTPEEVRDALRVCFDPELPVNIVDLGLVQDIRVALDRDAPGMDPRYAVEVDLTMRVASEEREPLLIAQVVNRLAGMERISRTTVLMTWTPPWTPDRMSAAARQQLGLDRPVDRLVNIQL
jgi:metal-sulfur cluster biosynthetic enzyme